jgi:hypothetical protein
MKDKNNKYNGKVIQTKYKGYHFRSRTEARWAVFFDKLGVKYEYEPEGFELPNGKCYLPDFYLPEFGGGGYFEVKPDVENEQEWLDNLEQLAKLTGKNCFILNGVPDYKYYGKYNPNDIECGWFALCFCGGDSNYMYEGGYFVEPLYALGQSILEYHDEDAESWFWENYIEAVNYSRAFRFDIDKLHL